MTFTEDQNTQDDNQINKDGGKHGGRGFASMDEERKREIASMGGRAAHEQGTAHEFTPEEAAEAGRKGGRASHRGHDVEDDDSNA